MKSAHLTSPSKVNHRKHGSNKKAIEGKTENPLSSPVCFIGHEEFRKGFEDITPCHLPATPEKNKQKQRKAGRGNKNHL